MNSSFRGLLDRFIKIKAIVKCRRYSCKVLFFGSDTFSLYSLTQLHLYFNIKDKILNVVTTLGSKQNVVEAYCRKKGISVDSWPPDLQSASVPYDIGVIVSFGHLIPKKIIQHFPLGMINVHASLLPRWRGASPIIHAIMTGDATTGVTIMRINPHHFDTGDIILQKQCDIDENELMPSLYERLGRLGADCLIQTMKSLPESLNKSVPQPNDKITLAPRIKPEIAQVQWADKSSLEVYNLYRALFSVYMLKTSWRGIAVKLKKLKTSEENVTGHPGQVHWLRASKKLLVGCKIGAVEIEVLSIGGKSVRGADFYNGYLSKRPLAEWNFS